MAKVSFNYKAVEDAKVRAQAQENARWIQASLARTGETLVEIGTRLEAMHLAMGSRLYREWIRFEFTWNQSTASNYERVALTFGGCEDLHRFQPSGITALSRKNVPARLIKEALDKAKAGETITGLWVRERLQALAVAPSRADAGKPRSKLEVRTGTAPTIQAMRFTLDQWKADLPKAVSHFTAAELADLEHRILDLMLQIRSAKPVPVTEQSAEPPVRRRGRSLAVA